jgi:hypothetical protein
VNTIKNYAERAAIFAALCIGAAVIEIARGAVWIYNTFADEPTKWEGIDG